jgi:hypothetical protein
MEERTFISGISDLIDNVGKCKCHDDARNLLNSFVVENVGKKYETEDGTAYRNSNNPKDIKRETLATIENTLYRWELLDEASEETLNEAIKYHNIRGGGTIKSNFVDLQVKIKVAKQYVEAWRKEAAPIIKKEKTPRLRPTEAGKKYAPLMYKHLQEIAYIDANEQSWNYLCGLTDETNDFKPVRWLKTDFLLKVLIDNFLKKETYFSVEAGAIKDTLYNSLADPEGNKIKQKSVEVAITNRQGEERRKSGEKRNPKTDEAIKNAWMNMRVNGML